VRSAVVDSRRQCVVGRQHLLDAHRGWSVETPDLASEGSRRAEDDLHIVATVATPDTRAWNDPSAVVARSS
jgi:hypothetical protein